MHLSANREQIKCLTRAGLLLGTAVICSALVPGKANAQSAPVTCIAAASSAAVSGTTCTWSADTNFSGGTPSSFTQTVTIPTSVTSSPPQNLFKNQRYGVMTYTIPNLTAGKQYSVKLLFAEEYYSAVGQRVFNVAINGASVLSNFDIRATAGASNTAVEKAFTATANSSGQIVIAFSAITDLPAINGIQVTPASAIPFLCIASASSSSISGSTCTWSSDTYFSGGTVSSFSAPVTIPSTVADVPPQEIFRNQRYGAMTYTIPGLTAGSQYQINLHFAEQYYDSVGQRVFNVAANGSQVLTNFDVRSVAGAKNVAVERSFTATANASGQVVVAFSAVSDLPIINGIQVASASGATQQPTTLTFAPNYTAMGTYTLSASSTSSAPVSYQLISGPAVLSGNSLNIFSGGTVVVRASQNATATSQPAVATSTLTINTTQSSQLTITSLGSGTTDHRGSDSPNQYIIDKNGQFFLENSYSQYNQVSADHNWSFFTGANEGTSAGDTTPAPDSSYNSSWSVGGVARPDSVAICTSGSVVWNTFTSKTGLTNGGGAYLYGNFCGVIGVWVDPDTGNWYGVVHNELYPNAPRYDALNWAISTDRGKTWTMKEPILTGANGIGDSRQYAYEYGAGDPKLYLDTASGYFYLSYLTRVMNNVTRKNSFYFRIARAPIRSKMAPSSWQKYYQGRFQAAPGIEWTCNPYTNSNCPAGGAPESQSTNLGADSNPVKNIALKWPISTQLNTDDYYFNLYSPFGVSWNVYLGKYTSVAADGDHLNLYTSDDLTTQQWTYAGQLPYKTVGDTPWYQWQRDPGTRTTTQVIGSTIEYLCTIVCDGPGRAISIARKSGVAAPVAYTSYNGTVSSTNTYVIQHPTASVPAASGTGSGWTFTPVGDGFFYVTQNGNRLTTATGDAGRAWGAGLTLAAPLASTSTGPQLSRQQWYFEPIKQISGTAVAANRYRLINRYSGLPLSFTAAGLTSSNLSAAVQAPNRDWDAAAGSAYTAWKVADQTLIFVAQ